MLIGKDKLITLKLFTIEDCDELEKVNYLMARKFDEGSDDKIINKLYDEL